MAGSVCRSCHLSALLLAGGKGRQSAVQAGEAVEAIGRDVLRYPGIERLELREFQIPHRVHPR